MDEARHLPGKPSGNVVCFGPFVFDLRAGELKKYGIRIRIREQALQVLAMLLEHPGDVLLRSEIRQRLWPDGAVVEFDSSTNAAVQRLRDALGDCEEKPRYIETVARRGYRFIGEPPAAWDKYKQGICSLPPN